MQWDCKNEKRAALQSENGSALVRGCEFQQDKPQVELSEKVRRAAVSDNVIAGEIAHY